MCRESGPGFNVDVHRCSTRSNGCSLPNHTEIAVETRNISTLTSYHTYRPFPKLISCRIDLTYIAYCKEKEKEKRKSFHRYPPILPSRMRRYIFLFRYFRYPIQAYDVIVSSFLYEMYINIYLVSAYLITIRGRVVREIDIENTYDNSVPYTVDRDTPRLAQLQSIVYGTVSFGRGPKSSTRTNSRIRRFFPRPVSPLVA